MKKVGFLGIGIMGRGMAANLLKKGFTVSVWNRDPLKCEPLVKMGATMAPNIAALSQSSEVVISMLRDDEVVRTVLLEQALPAAHSGTTFIDMSTVTPRMSRQLAEAAAKMHVHFLDAPVLGSKDAAEAGQLTALVGGSVEILERQRDLLSAMCQKIVHVGPNGSSAYLKLACNQLVAVIMAAMGESLALVEKAGLDRQAALDVLVATVSRVAGMKHPKIAEREWSTHFALDLMFKDLTQTLEAADELQIPMPVLAITRETYQRARRQGKGSFDFSIIAGIDGKEY